MKFFLKYFSVVVLCALTQLSFAKQESSPKLDIKVNSADGSYEILNQDNLILHAQVAAKINGKWLLSSDYPNHDIKRKIINDELGFGQRTIITHTGLANQPDLICTLHLHPVFNTGEISVEVSNQLHKPVAVQAIRVLEANDFNFGKNLRVLSDSFSEDRPVLQVRDFNDALNNMHRAVGSQLFYNRDVQQSLFFAALTSNKFLSIMRFDVKKNHYEIDSTGTTEISKEYSLKESPEQDQVDLSLSLDEGKSLASERVMFSLNSDYHQQLEIYGKLIRTMHHARVTAPTLMGWWSWTAYYRELNQKQASKDAEWLSQHLKKLGYDFFHLDEGYQAARGDYTKANLQHFPDGMEYFGNKVRDLDLKLGIWTAPFEVAGHSDIYQNHKDWLVSNAEGKPISIGFITDDDVKTDELFALDPTHPQVQQYLRDTYTTITKKWGARYFKFDFMEDTAIEGHHYQPNVTALEAQRIGIDIIRNTVGDEVLIDKDGSPMLNLVGAVDTGRTSVDTAHSFVNTKNAAHGIAARYYMHRNFFITDPDAFTISRYQSGTEQPISLDEAKTSIALAAVSGGMFEIGDNLQLLSTQPERLKLLENPELLAIVRAGRVSTPVDLMDYLAEDEQPSIFFLAQDAQQGVLTVFNWTEQVRTHTFKLSDLGFNSKVTLLNVLDEEKLVARDADKITLVQPPHTVRMIKIMGGLAK